MRGWGCWHAQDPDGFVENGGWDFLDAEGGDDDEEGEDSEEEGAFLRKISIIVGRPCLIDPVFFWAPAAVALPTAALSQPMQTQK